MQLPTLGLAPADISRVILSHFHADHVAGLIDFPQAEIICSQAAYEHVLEKQGMAALARAYLPELLPTDFAARTRSIKRFASTPLAGLGETHDLFGDGTIQLVELPGHARGQIGALVRAADRDILLAADGCWQRESIRTQQPPHGLTHFFIDDPLAMRRTLARLLAFHQAYPEVTIVPTHCPEAYAELVRTQPSHRQAASLQPEFERE